MPAMAPSEGARLLGDVMRKLGLSNREVQRRCKFSDGMVSRILNGDRGPSGPTRTRLQQEFAIPSTSWDEPPKKKAS